MPPGAGCACNTGAAAQRHRKLGHAPRPGRILPGTSTGQGQSLEAPGPRAVNVPPHCFKQATWIAWPRWLFLKKNHKKPYIILAGRDKNKEKTQKTCYRSERSSNSSSESQGTTGSGGSLRQRCPRNRRAWGTAPEYKPWGFPQNMEPALLLLELNQGPYQ